MRHSTPSLIVLGLALLTACSWDATPPGDEAAPAGSRPEGAGIGYKAPAFELPRLAGADGASTSSLSLTDLQGKVTLVSFWASWCRPCAAELPALEEAWEHYQSRGVSFLGVSVDDRAEDARRFLTEHPVSFTNVLDKGGLAMADRWSIGSLPTTVLLDGRGVVRARHVGFTPAQLRTTLVEIDRLLEE